MPPLTRRPTVTAIIGGVPVGAGHPIVVQSMTNTDTADVAATVQPGRRPGPCRQRAGSGDGQQRGGRGGRARDRRRARAASASRCRSSATSITTATCSSRSIRPAPARWPSTASTRATWAASGTTRTSAPSSRSRSSNDKPVRIGVNWGSLDQNLLTEMMDANARRTEPAGRPRRDDGGHGGERPPERRARRGGGLAHDRIVLSAKVSGVQDLVEVYRHARRALRLPAAPRPHRGRARRQGHHREHGRPQHSSSGRDR